MTIIAAIFKWTVGTVGVGAGLYFGGKILKPRWKWLQKYFIKPKWENIKKNFTKLNVIYYCIIAALSITGGAISSNLLLGCGILGAGKRF